MNTAILDLGTNTFNLLVAEVINGSVELIHREKVAVKLGENGFKTKMLMPEAINRGLNAIGMLLESAQAAGAENISAFATSAVRNAKNRNEFLEAVQERYGITIDVISGEEEAEFIYEGVRHSGVIGDEKVLIMDIGGGSTEFVIADKNQTYWLKSYDIGAARLKELFKPENPISNGTVKKITDYLTEQFEELSRKIQEYDIETLIGSSGSFDSFVDMIAASKREPYPNFEVSNTIEIADLEAVVKEMISSTLVERQNRAGLITMRIDFIVISCLLVNAVLKMSSIKHVKQCSYSLKEGVLFKNIKK